MQRGRRRQRQRQKIIGFISQGSIGPLLRLT